MFPQCPSMDLHIAFPIVKGDTVLLIFSEVELDAWLYNGKSSNDMKYALTSAIAIPGLYQKGNDAIKEACSTESIVIKSENAKILVQDSEIAVKVSDTEMSLSSSGIALKGNVTVSGNIYTTGTVSGSNLRN